MYSSFSCSNTLTSTEIPFSDFRQSALSHIDFWPGHFCVCTCPVLHPYPWPQMNLNLQSSRQVCLSVWLQCPLLKAWAFCFVFVFDFLVVECTTSSSHILVPCYRSQLWHVHLAITPWWPILRTVHPRKVWHARHVWLSVLGSNSLCLMSTSDLMLTLTHP